MSTFYVLPSRTLLGQHFAGYLRDLFPGLHWRFAARSDLADTLSAAVECQPDVYVVYREDLPEDEDPARALADGFGAEPGDVIIEIELGARQGDLITRRWHLDRAA